jgi:two-component system sensor histidine kinase PilS (NtrC family)
MPVRSVHPEPLAIVGHTDAQLRQRFLYLTASRVTVCTVIFGGTIAVYLAEAHSFDGPTPRLLLGVIVAIYLVSLGYALQIRRATTARLEMLTSLSIGLDLMAWTVLAYATGGAGSPLSTLFGLTTLTAALVLGGNGTLWTAVGSLGLYGLMALLTATGILPPPSDQVRIAANPIETTYQMVVTLTAVIAVTAIGGSLADRLVLAGDALVRAEASRANLAGLYEDVLRSIPSAIFTFDAEGHIDSANTFGAEFIGIDAPALLGVNLRALLPFLAELDESALREGTSGDAVLQTVRGDVPVAYHVAPVYDREGAIRGGVVVVDDRSNVESLRSAFAQAERFADLGRLAAGLAHEVRNPLGAISGCVELVRETARLDDEERALLRTVLTDVARLNNLVTDMLQFARPRPPDLADADLVGLARDVVALARTSSGPESKVGIAVEADGAVSARVDAGQIRQVLWNLIRNAAQVSRAGGEVRVVVQGSAERVEVAVHDEGPGVAAELRERIFEAFYSNTARGTGLGLAIVKRIADAHGGRVEVREREGGGSVFAVQIPRRGPAVTVEPRRPSDRPATRSSDPS